MKSLIRAPWQDPREQCQGLATSEEMAADWQVPPGQGEELLLGTLGGRKLSERPPEAGTLPHVRTWLPSDHLCQEGLRQDSLSREPPIYQPQWPHMAGNT